MPINLKEFVKNSLYGFFAACARDLDVTLEKGASLVIAPHPDDESLGCGATIARLRAQGEVVRIVIVTDGAASGKSDTIGPEKISATRRSEAQTAAEALGVSRDNVIFLQFPDGNTESHIQALEDALNEQIHALDFRRIFSPYGTDGHPDHRVIAAAVDRLVQKGTISCHLYEYPIWFWSFRALGHVFLPHKLIRLKRVPTGSFLAAKKAAIAAHRSQYEAPTDEAGWFVFPAGFLNRFLTSFELFFEKPLRRHQ